MNTEERLAVATELLRQAENVLDPPWLGQDQRDIRWDRFKLKSRIQEFLDREFAEMGIEDRQSFYKGDLNGPGGTGEPEA